MRKTLRILRDLLEFLPGQMPTSWEQTGEIEPDRPIVILIPGFQARERPVSILRKRFIRDGYSVLVLSMDWLSPDGVVGLYRMAKRLSRVILDLRKRVGMNDKKVYLVGHSAGGLVARYYVQQLGGYHYCDGLVTLGTPHQGSWFAALGFFSLLIVKARCLFQLLPVSPFIRKLNQSYYPKNFRMISISSTDDYFCGEGLNEVVPENEKNCVEDILVSGLNHDGLLLSKKVYEITQQSLGLVSSTQESATNR